MCHMVCSDLPWCPLLHASQLLSAEPSTSSAQTTRRSSIRAAAAHTTYPPASLVAQLPADAPTDVLYDAVIIGSGMGGLATAARMAAKGAKVLVLEK